MMFFKHASTRLLILGNDPSTQLLYEARKSENVEIIPGLNSNEIIQHIRDAQVNVLPTFQSTGIKLKLVNALYHGGHCVVNTPMIEKTGLLIVCHLADNPEELARLVDRLMDIQFEEKDVLNRKQHLMENLSDDLNADRLIEIIFDS